MNNNTVELLGYYGSDAVIAQSAWTSTSRDLSVEKIERIPNLLIQLWSQGHECYDNKTEVLTKRGWVLFSELTNTDEICSVDPVTHTWKFEIPSRIVSYDYSEPMYYVKAANIDIAVTKNHRLLTSVKKEANGSDYGNKWIIETPQDVFKKNRKYLCAAKNNNVNKLDTNFAKLLGFFIGDGYAESKNRCTFHLKKQRKIDYLNSLGYNIEIKKSDKYVINNTNYDFTLCYDLNKNKIIPFDIYTLGPDDFKNILDGLLNSDGSHKNRGYNEFVFHNTSAPLINQLKILGCLNNLVVNEHRSGPTVRRLLISNRIKPEISNMKSRKIGEDYWEHYNGKVYCATVSTGFMMVRRNSKPIVCGNTPFEKATVHFLVNCDIATHIHLLKHRISSMNAESARYKEHKEDKFYLPEDWKSSYKLFDTETLDWKWYSKLKKITEEYNKLYHECLEELTPVLGRKRAKESARFFKTYNSQIQADVTFNLRSFANFLRLRNSEHAQLEIREIAQQMQDLVEAIDDRPFKTAMWVITRANELWIKHQEEISKQLIEEFKNGTN